jgi:uncharacterized protein (TIGR02271 family)
MQNVQDATKIRTGWDVYGSDGQHLGSVGEIGDNYLLVQKGLIFVHDIFVPVSAVDRVEEEAVWLNVPKADVDTMGWDMPPTEGTWTAWSQHGGSTAATQEQERMAVHEEELEARTTARRSGEVQVRKDVIEEERTIEVPVTREEVQIKRVPVDREATGTEASFDEGETIRVPVMEEDVEVTKRPRVKEEIEITKVARKGTKRATGTVRKERVDVTKEGDANLRGSSSQASTSTRGHGKASGDDDESGTEALGAGAGALGGAAVGGAVAGPPGAIVGGLAGAAAGGLAGEATEGDDQAGSAAGGAGGMAAGAVIGGAIAGPPGAVVGGAVGAGAGAGLGDKTEEEAKGEDDDTRDTR